MSKFAHRNDSGFTIIEIVVVIIVIGILSVIAVVSYNGIAKSAQLVSIKSDISNIIDHVANAKVFGGKYPESVTDCPTPTAGNVCYNVTTGNTVFYEAYNSTYSWKKSTYIVTVSKDDQKYYSIDDSPAKPALPFTIDQSDFQVTSDGIGYACAIFSVDHKAYCWGDNSNGQLGNGTKNSSLIPTAVDTSGVLSGKTIKAITSASGSRTACAIASDDKVYCWGGSGSVGALGNGIYSDSSVPVEVDMTVPGLAGKTAKSISASCMINSDDKAFCWGMNDGMLGNGSMVKSAVPVAVDTTGVLLNKTFKKISSDVWHNCAIASDDNAYCWGSDSNGQLGNNASIGDGVTLPVAVSTAGALSGKKIKDISSGDWHTCVVTTDGLGYCWGDNQNGQLGNGDENGEEQPLPVAVDMTGALVGKTLKSISAGDNQTCALASDDLEYCWGSLYDGYTPNLIDNGSVFSGKTIKHVAAGAGSVYMIASDGRLYSFGNHWNGLDGFLGNGTIYGKMTPSFVYSPL